MRAYRRLRKACRILVDATSYKELRKHGERVSHSFTSIHSQTLNRLLIGKLIAMLCYFYRSDFIIRLNSAYFRRILFVSKCMYSTILYVYCIVVKGIEEKHILSFISFLPLKQSVYFFIVILYTRYDNTHYTRNPSNILNNSLRYVGPKIWNPLPAFLQSVRFYNSF